MHCRPASVSGNLFTYDFGWNVSSSREMPMKPTSALGNSSWAAWRKPRPARNTGTTIGWAASTRPLVSVSGVVTRTVTVGRLRVASARSSEPIRSISCRNRALGVLTSRTRTSESAINGWST